MMSAPPRAAKAAPRSVNASPHRAFPDFQGIDKGGSMRLFATLLILAAFVLTPLAPARAYTLQYTSAAATTQIHWPTTNITVALSDSLNNPPSYVHATGPQGVL